MRIGIDAINIRTGGGLNHLKEILLNLDPVALNIEKVIIWATKPTLDNLFNSTWIKKIDVEHIASSWGSLLWWNLKTLEKELITEQCEVLFVPGGTYIGKFRPYITMVQNLLPFDKIERKKYKYSKDYFRYLLLEFLQAYTFRRANGVIFLSNHSQKIIMNEYFSSKEIKTQVIYHGVDDSYFNINRNQKLISINRLPLRLLYVSIINYYKNQINVVKALEILINKNYDIKLELIGPAYSPALKDLQNFIDNNNMKNRVTYKGPLNKDSLIENYNNSDIFVFASSCESFGMILLEAMASGLPIACSNKTAMPEILGENGEYFNPDDPISISLAIESILNDKGKSKNYSYQSIKRAEKFTWKKCSTETFKFISSLGKERINVK